MSRNDFDRIFEQLDALTVGFGPLFRDFKVQTPHYPPHNIVRLSDAEFFLELAVAGFKKNEVKMEEHQGILTITGEKEDIKDSDLLYQYRGIAGRSFTKSFRIAEYWEISDAVLEDGILKVKFTKNIPEEARPRLIAIK